MRRKALARGAAGLAWIDSLPATARELERRWGVTIGATLSGGTEAYVAEATTAGGNAAVIKVAMPTPSDTAFARSVTAYELAAGRGCAALLAVDHELQALLLERLGPSLFELAPPVDEQLRTICAAVSQLWVPVPPDCDLPTGDAAASWLGEHIVRWWEQLGRPCSADAVEIALGCARSRASAFDPRQAVLVHGDAHSSNTLRASDGTFKLVDPEGLASEPAHDLGIPMRELGPEHLGDGSLEAGRAKARHLADLTGVDPGAIWEWGFVERVSTGLYCLVHDIAAGRGYLDVADRWARELRPSR